MKEYIKEITDSLQTNTTLQSLIIIKSESVGIRHVQENMIIRTNNSRKLQCKVVDGRIFFKEVTSSSNNREVNVKILYNSDCECSPETIKLSDKNINDDTVCLISFGLYNNTTVEKLDLSCNKITHHGVIAIIDSLKQNNTLKELNLSQNEISIEGMKKLSECITHTIPLEYVDLSGNKSSPWGVYCAIIRHCCVNSLTLCGDKGMKEYVKEIANSLQTNTTLHSLTLYVSRKSSVNMQPLPEGTIVEAKELRKLQSKVNVIDGRIFFNALVNDDEKVTSSNDNRVVNVKIMYNDVHEYSPETINLSDKNVNDDTVCLISFGLYNNATVQKLDLSYNKITDIGAIAIIDSLKQNNTLKELNLSQNEMDIKGMIKLSACITHTIPLEYVNLSGNKSSPWGVYCAIIRHCCVNSLTLCGDEEMNEYVKEITDSLQINTTLQSLTLHGIGRIGVQSIKDVLGSNMILKEIRMSWMSKGRNIIINRKLTYSNTSDNKRLDSNSNRVVDINILYDGECECSCRTISLSNQGIDDDAVYLITFGLYNNTTLQELDLSYNNITDDGAVAISDCFRNNYSPQTLILSRNRIYARGAKKIAEMIQVNKIIQKLDMSHNEVTDDGVIAISECLKTNNTLQELNLSNNQITCKGARKIAEAIKENKGLSKLDISQNDIYDDGVMHSL